MQVSLTPTSGDRFADLGVTDDVPRPCIFYMDSHTRLFRLRKDGLLTRPTLAAINSAVEHYLPVMGSSQDPVWKALIEEVKGYSFTQKPRDQSIRQTFTGA
jgi:hypothetical protein